MKLQKLYSRQNGKIEKTKKKKIIKKIVLIQLKL
jgi:hypothetical protein